MERSKDRRRSAASAGLAAAVGALAALAALTSCASSRPSNAGPVVTGFDGAGYPTTAAAFQWSASDPDGDPVSCTLDADGDGTTDATIADCVATTSAFHSYAAPGLYTATLTASDDHGHVTKATATAIANGTSTAKPTWVREIGTSADDGALGGAVDASGAAYLAGYTGGILSAASAGGKDATLVKFDEAGATVWQRQIGTSADDYGYDVAVDPGGGVYLVGYTRGTLAGANAGGVDAFVARFDGDGTLAWARQLGTSGDDYAVGVATGPGGDAFVAGFTGGALEGTSAGATDAFLARYDHVGNQVWVRQFGTASDDLGWAVDADAAGNVALVGTTQGDLEGVSAGLQDGFLALYDTSGNHVRTVQFGSSADDFAYGVALDGDGGAVVAGTTFGALAAAYGGASDAVVLRFAADGTVAWSHQFSTSTADRGLGIALDTDGNTLLAAVTNGGGIVGFTRGREDAILVKLDPSGAMVWARSLGQALTDIGYGTMVDAEGNVFLLGTTDGLLPIGNFGMTDQFVAKYVP